MQTDNLPFIDLFAVALEQAPAILQVEQTVAQGFALHHGHQYAVDAAANIAHFHRPVVVKNAGHNARAGGQGQEVGAETDQAARRRNKLEFDPALAVRLHIGEFGLAQAELFHHRTLMLIFNINHDLLEGLLNFAVHFALHHFRTGYAQLKAFAAHVFNQH